MNWSSQSVNLGVGVQQFRIRQDGRYLSHEKVHQLWATSPAFADFYSSTILDSGFESLCWETPPVTLSNLSTDHEFVVIESPLLQSRVADPSPFHEHFRSSRRKVISFPNLGRNGIMITPVPPQGGANYNHLVNFLRTAPHEDTAELWRVTSEALKANLETKPRWLSTAGLGVSWLHVRIDTRPKYYRHDAYRTTD